MPRSNIDQTETILRDGLDLASRQSAGLIVLDKSRVLGPRIIDSPQTTASGPQPETSLSVLVEAADAALGYAFFHRELFKPAALIPEDSNALQSLSLIHI